MTSIHEEWTCAAKKQGTIGGNDPADCDWPVCGCDPYADKVVTALEASGALVRTEAQPAPSFPLGARVRKIKGSSWQGIVVGHYSTKLTPDGCAVESEREPGSVQIYPASALQPAVVSHETLDDEPQAGLSVTGDRQVERIKELQEENARLRLRVNTSSHEWLP